MRKKLIADVCVLMSWAMFLLVVLWCSSSSGDVIAMDDFEDDSRSLIWSWDRISTTPSGRSFLGPFGVETVNLIIEMPANYHTAFIVLDVYAIGTWPESDPGPWYLPLAFAAWQCIPSDESMPALIDGDLIGQDYRTEVGTLGYALENRVYHYQEPLLGFGESWYAVSFSGATEGMQWGLDNVTVFAQGDVIPEPSAGQMLATLFGLVLIVLCVRRLRSIGREDFTTHIT